MDTDHSLIHRIGSALRIDCGTWALMTLYERFEQLVAMALSLIIAVLMLIALFQLYARVFLLVIDGALNPLDHEVFQTLFGSILLFSLPWNSNTRL